MNIFLFKPYSWIAERSVEGKFFGGKMEMFKWMDKEMK